MLCIFSNMYVGVERYNEGVWYKVILYCWEHLDNISPLPPHVQVVDGGTINVCWWRDNRKGVGPEMEAEIAIKVRP